MNNVSSKRIGELLTDVEEKRLKLRPQFQRRLVWTNIVKDKFLDTVLKQLPFPEIFVAAGELDSTKLKRVNWLVDGQQRISTLREYVIGSPNLILKTVKAYSELSEDERTKFSDYIVAVRDLGAVSEAEVKEIFSRINSTDYSLKSIERLNALFNGELKNYCETLSNHEFFQSRHVFTTMDFRRMRDLDFCIILTITMLSTYYHRDELHKEYLSRFNDSFPEKDEVSARLKDVFEFLEACKLPTPLRAWRKTDLLTLLVELDSTLNIKQIKLNTALVGQRLRLFYTEVDALFRQDNVSNASVIGLADVSKYLKAATKATNDKYSRIARGEVINKLITSDSLDPVGRKRPRARKASTSKKK